METGEAKPGCASLCKPTFASVHCPFCACSACAFCKNDNALKQALAAIYRPPLLPPPREPPSPPPPPSPPETVVQRIDRWWREGEPNNDVTKAGVIVRQLDELVRKGFHEWEPCPEQMWCGKFSRIWPSSLINKHFNQAVYAGGQGARRKEGAVGFVLAPPPTNQFHCIYPSDANSMGAIEQEVKGQITGNHACGATCKPPEMRACSFPPEGLETALKANANFGFDSRFKYNEVVVDAERMKAALPHSLLGIFYMGPETKEQAVSIHVQFLANFKVSNEEFPLMQLSLEEGFRAG